jgi:hypothetical protein
MPALDSICSRDPHQQLSIVDAQIDKSHDNGRYPSDHYFVTATFACTTKK